MVEQSPNVVTLCQRPINGATVEGPPVDGRARIQDLARQLVNETREVIPVADENGKVIGVMQRKDALDLLLGAG